MTEITKLEEFFCTRFDRKHAFLAGRGTTAIWLALRAIKKAGGGGEIILPTLGCASLTQIVLQAGFRPVFADVDPVEFTLAPSSFESKITTETRGVLAVHLFGHPARMKEICEIADRHGIFVVEDAAQSIGGTWAGKKMGSWGHFSIFSFGGQKIVNAGTGGALLLDDPGLAAIVSDEIRSLPYVKRDRAYELMSLSHRNLYHSVVDLLRGNPHLSVHQVFAPAIPLYEPLYLQAFDGNEAVGQKITEEITRLDQNNAERIKKAYQYHSLLNGNDQLVLPSNWREAGTLWRYTFLISDPQKLLMVTQKLRKNRIHASNHYWSMADLLYGEKDHPNTAYVCPRILNLWVDESTAGDYISRSCEIILSGLQ